MIYRERPRAMFDGRKVGRHRNRRRIVAAMLELVRAEVSASGK